ncbi:hypothetical protein AB5I41_10070 [Sphingomonas sp. MMS24-JH45]
MFLKRLALTGLLGGLAMATAACTDGYSGVNVGYGAGYYDDPYYAGGGWGGSGWNGGYGSPISAGTATILSGTGVVVYDRYRRAHPWNGDQRRYWRRRHSGSYGTCAPIERLPPRRASRAPGLSRRCARCPPRLPRRDDRSPAVPVTGGRTRGVNIATTSARIIAT